MIKKMTELPRKWNSFTAYFEFYNDLFDFDIDYTTKGAFFQ